MEVIRTTPTWKSSEPLLPFLVEKGQHEHGAAEHQLSPWLVKSGIVRACCLFSCEAWFPGYKREVQQEESLFS